MIRVAAAGDLHFGVECKGRIRTAFARVAEHADLLLLAGDLTRLGTREEGAAVAEELEELGVPTVAVLGNHDYQSGQEAGLTDLLELAGIRVLEGEGATFDVAGRRVGVAGVKGFGGDFVGACASAFSESEMKQFVRRAEQDAEALGASLAGLGADVSIALTHYARTDSTLDGEPLQIHPFLGSYQLGEAIDRSRAVPALHGHAHRGVEIGSTIGGAHVRNVALPVINSAYRVYCIGDPDGTAEVSFGEDIDLLVRAES